MAKKVTVSVPEDLYERMQKWKDSLNFSGIFQEAVLNRIGKKEEYENFKQKTKGNIDMDKIIERLKEERDESTKDYFEHGKQEGYGYAKEFLHYAGFQHALQYETTKELLDRAPNTTEHDPTTDDWFGEYFRMAIEDEEEGDTLIGWASEPLQFLSDDGNSKIVGEKILHLPNEYFIEWEAGFIEGIKDFWNEIKDKL